MNDFWSEVQRILVGENLSDETAGVETSIRQTWPWPPWVLLALMLAFAAMVIFVYVRERSSAGRLAKTGLAAIRLAIAGVLALMLLGWTIQRHRTDLPDIVVILDDSQSMGLPDAQSDPRWRKEMQRRLSSVKLTEPTRLNLAKTLLLEKKGALLTDLAQKYHLKFYLAGGTARARTGDQDAITSTLQSLEAKESASRLGKSLRDVLEAQRGRPTAAVIMLTDGITSEGKPLSETADYARRKGVPLFFIGLGSDQPARNLRVSDLLVDDVTFVSDLIHFDFKLTAEGYEGPVTVRLKRKGEAVALTQQTLQIPRGGSSQSLRLSHRPDQKGEFEYTVETDLKEGETSKQDNRLVRTVRVTEETIRVLFVQSGPSWEFRSLKTMLERELNRNEPKDSKDRGFRTVLQEADPAYVDTDKSAEKVFPVSREELFKYDVLMFGDVNPAFLSPSVMSNIYEFVTTRGGGLIFIAGPKYTPLSYRDTALAPLLPLDLDTAQVPDVDAIVKEEFRPRLTALGLSSPQMQIADTAIGNTRLWNEQLPPLRWHVTAPDLRPGVRVLAEHPTKKGNGGKPLPLITLQFVGSGKVVFHATDETHRWRFRVGDVYFSRYWIQTIRYLARARLLGKSRAAELAADREEYRRGDVVRLRARFFDDRLAPPQDDGVSIVLEHEGSQRRSVRMRRDAASRGLFEVTLDNLADGKYRCWIASPTLEGQPPSTSFIIIAPPGELARTRMDSTDMKLAAKATGGKFYTFADAEKLSADLPKGRQVRIASMPPRPLWNAPLLAGLFVVLLGTEWMLRKRCGLL
jgi:von Willebrand factor type A domain